jgi:prepilin signal peptidase PulO-like enzyme (type II secretory pathway)
VIELLTGLLFLGCYLHFGLTLAAEMRRARLSAAGLDLHRCGNQASSRRPDACPGFALGIVFSLVVPVNDLASRIMPGLVSPAMRGEISWRLWSLADSLLGAAVGASFLYGAAAIYLRARGVEGMGFGDVKLMAMIGAFLGTKLTVLTIFAASLAGSLFGLSTVLAVWMKRMRRFAGPRRLQEALRVSSAIPQKMRAGAPGNRRALPCAITRCPLVCFSAAWRILSFLFGNRLLHWYWRAL